MLSKLIWKSFQKKIRNYVVYLISMTFSVMVFYSFNAILADSALADNLKNNVEILPLLTLGGWMIFFILLFFMIQTNHFFMEQNEEEISVYFLLGVKKNKLYLFFVLETFLMGLIALGSGILLGILYSKLFAMILVKAMGLVIPVNLFVSAAAIATTVKAFLFVLLILALQTIKILRTFRLAKKLKFNQPTKLIKKITIWDCLLGVLGIVFLLLSLGLTLYFSKIKDTYYPGDLSVLPYLQIGLVIFSSSLVGLGLFYSKTSLLIYDLLKKRKKFYLKRLHSVSTSMFASRLTQDWQVSAIVTIFLTGLLSMLSITVFGLYFGMNIAQKNAPVAFFVSASDYPKAQAVFKEHPKAKAQNVPLHFKTVGAAGPIFPNQQKTGIIDLMPLSDYRQYEKINPALKRLPTLKENEAVYLNLDVHVKPATTIQLTQGNLKVVKTLSDQIGGTSLCYGSEMFVVADAFFNTQQGVAYTNQAIAVKPEYEEQLNALLKENLKENWDQTLTWRVTLADGVVKQELIPEKQKDSQGFYETSRVNYVSQFDSYQIFRSTTGLVLYIAMFVGMAVVITTASMLSLRQLSAVKKQRHDFYLLKRLGVANNELIYLLHQENASVFFLPLILALLYAVCSTLAFSQTFTGVDYWLPIIFCGALTVVYGIFYGLTMIFCKKQLPIE